ncbi:hypothetical protein GVAV_003236 [Gurleya vavrai]
MNVTIPHKDLQKKIENIQNRLNKYKKEYADQNIRENKFKEGDFVWYLNKFVPVNKLESAWSSKGTIRGVEGGAYKVELENGKLIRANEEHLRKVGTGNTHS